MDARNSTKDDASHPARPRSARPWYSLTLRRSALWIAGIAVILGLLRTGVHAGENPGLYWSISPWSVGLCRNGGAGVGIDQLGRPTGHLYQAGVWRKHREPGMVGIGLPSVGVWTRWDNLYVTTGGSTVLGW